MGRVSSKRKIKQCDPFFRGKRENGKKAKEFDLPPTQSKRSKKRKRKQEDERLIEQFVLRTSQVDDGSDAVSGVSKKKKKALQISSIGKNESMREFNKRINTEVKRVIYDETKKNKRSNVKRKEYLSKKKEKEKIKKMTDQERYELEYQATGSTKKDYFEDTEKVRFGERVDAPPIMPKLGGIFKKRAKALEKQLDAKRKRNLSTSAAVISGARPSTKKAKK